MSKDFVEFPWKISVHEDPPQPELKEKPSTKESLKTLLVKYRHLIMCIAAIFFLSILLKTRSQSTNVQNSQEPPQSQISIVVPVVAFPKGSILEARLLKPVIGSKKDFSKSQLLNVFMEEDIERIDDRLIAKKDLVPYKPIFWNSLELKRIPKPNRQNIKILYPVTEGTPP